MELMKLKTACEEMDIKNVKTIHRMAARGLLKILRMPGDKRDSLRVDAAAVRLLIEKIKRGEKLTAEPADDAPPPKLQRQRRFVVSGRADIKLPKPPKKIRHYA